MGTALVMEHANALAQMIVSEKDKLYRKLSGTVTSMRWHLRIFLRIRRQGRILIVRDIPF